MVAAVPPPPSGSAGTGFWLGNLAVPWLASPSAASSLGVVPQPEAHVGPRECARGSASPKGKVSIMHVVKACLQDLEQFQISSPSGSVPCTGLLDPMWVEAALQPISVRQTRETAVPPPQRQSVAADLDPAAGLGRLVADLQEMGASTTPSFLECMGRCAARSLVTDDFGDRLL
jgi:hypothetical protein